MKRRELVKSGFFLLSVAVPAFASRWAQALRLKKSGQIKYVIRCRLPHAMTYEDFSAQERSWTNRKLVHQINSDFSARGLLFEDQFDLQPSSIQWTYYFKNQKAFSAWAAEVERKKVLNSSAILPGFVYEFERTENA